MQTHSLTVQGFCTQGSPSICIGTRFVVLKGKNHQRFIRENNFVLVG